MNALHFGQVKPLQPKLESAPSGARGSVSFELSNGPGAGEKHLDQFRLLTAQPEGNQVELHLLGGLGGSEVYIRNLDGKNGKPTAAQIDELLALVRASEPVHTEIPLRESSLLKQNGLIDYRDHILDALHNTLLAGVRRLINRDHLNQALLALLHAAETDPKNKPKA